MNAGHPGKRALIRTAAPLSEILSPRGLAVRAALLAALFAACHLAGFREYTSFLCGMDPSALGPGRFKALLGLIYVLAYVSVTVLVPVMAIAAVLLAAAGRGEATARSEEAPAPTENRNT